MEAHNKVDLIAQIVYEANRAYTRLSGSKIPVQPDWEITTGDVQGALRHAVYEELINPVSIDGYIGENILEASHDRWATAKITAGWKYGKTYSVKHKTHPNLVSYEKLPEEEKVKDRLFLELVHTLKKIL